MQVVGEGDDHDVDLGVGAQVGHVGVGALDAAAGGERLAALGAAGVVRHGAGDRHVAQAVERRSRRRSPSRGCRSGRRRGAASRGSGAAGRSSGRRSYAATVSFFCVAVKQKTFSSVRLTRTRWAGLTRRVARPDESSRPRPAAAGAGTVLRLIREGRATTRAEIIAMTGLARSTVTQRLDQLLAERLVVPAGEAASTGGRPPERAGLQPRRRRGAGRRPRRDALAARRSPTSAARSSARWPRDIPIADGPEVVLDWVETGFDALLAQAGAHGGGRARHRHRRARAGRVRHRAARSPRRSCPAGTATRSRARLAGRYGAPTLVDNDVNTMALGEHWAHWRTHRPPAAGQGRHGDRLRDRRRRHRSCAARRARRATSATSRSPATRASSAAAGTSAAWRRWRAAARWRRSCARSGLDADGRARRGGARARRAARGGGRGARGRARAGQRAGHQREPLQPRRDRDRRRPLPRRGAPARGRARGRLPALAAAGHAQPADRAQRASTSARGWSARR